MKINDIKVIKYLFILGIPAAFIDPLKVKKNPKAGKVAKVELEHSGMNLYYYN